MYEDKNISVIIPAYNEAATIRDVINAMPDYIDRIIGVDDGSFLGLFFCLALGAGLYHGPVVPVSRRLTLKYNDIY